MNELSLVEQARKQRANARMERLKNELLIAQEERSVIKSLKEEISSSNEVNKSDGLDDK